MNAENAKDIFYRRTIIWENGYENRQFLTEKPVMTNGRSIIHMGRYEFTGDTPPSLDKFKIPTSTHDRKSLSFRTKE